MCVQCNGSGVVPLALPLCSIREWKVSSSSSERIAHAGVSKYHISLTEMQLGSDY